jgi:hypothetical protein
MDEQQLRDALLASARGRYQELEAELAGVIRQRKMLMMQVEEVAANQHRIQGMMDECANWIQAFKEGKFVEVETDDEPEGEG